MRCPKCGFNGFDYLAECRKCGADLTRTQQELGLLNVKPTAPFLLGALLKEHKAAEAVPKEQSTPDLFADFEQVGVDLEKNRLQPSLAKPHGMADVRMDFAQPAKVSSQPAAPAPAGAAAGDDATIEFGDDLTDWSFPDAQMEEPPAAPVEKAAAVEPAASQAGGPASKQKPAAAEEDSIIELSEEDLEGLFLELDDADDRGDEGHK